MKIYKRSFNRCDLSSEQAFLLFDGYEILTSSILVSNPIDNKYLIGSTFVNILNNQDSLYKKFDNFINTIQTTKSLDIIPQLITFEEDTLSFENNYLTIWSKIRSKYKDFYSKFNNPSKYKAFLEENIKIHESNINNEDRLKYLYPNVLDLNKIKEKELDIMEKLKEKIKNLDEARINDLCNIFQEYFNDIKSILMNFSQYINETDNINKEKIKNYLLFGTKIPNHSFLVGSFNKNTLYINYSYSNIETKKLNNVIPIKEFKINDFLQYLDINIDLFFQDKFSVNRCQHCEKYFIPKSRKDEKYCDNIFINNLTCKEYAPKFKFNNKEITKKYNEIVGRYRSKLRKYENSPMKIEFILFKKQYKEKKNLVKKNKSTESELLSWLENQDIEYRRKYSKNGGKTDGSI